MVSARRLQHRGIHPARSGADDLHARHPVLADDLSERCACPSPDRSGPARTDRLMTAFNVADAIDTSTSTTPASRASSRASVSAVSDVPCGLRHTHHRDLARGVAKRTQFTGDALEIADRRGQTRDSGSRARGIGAARHRQRSGVVSRMRGIGAATVRGARRGHPQELAGDDRAGRQHQRRERRDQHDRQLLREGRNVGDDGARDDASV